MSRGHRFSKRIYAAPFGRYESGSEVEPPANEVLVGREGQRAYFIDILLKGGRRGAYLITGHRGVGKTNFVRYCLAEYKREVLERFLRGNVGRATFWDRILLLGLVLVLSVSALMISELAELISLAIEDVSGPRNILLWVVLTPLVILCLYPMLYAADVLQRVLRTARARTEWLPVSLVVAVCVGLVWLCGPFGAPALSLSRLLCSLAALYLWFQCTAFRRSWPTLLFLLLLALYVFLLPRNIGNYELTPLKEFRGNLELTLLLGGLGCILQGISILRLKSNGVTSRARRSISLPYIWIGLGLMGLGLVHLLYQGTQWASLAGAALMILAAVSFWFWSAKRREVERTRHFYPEPILILLFKVLFAVVVSLQLIHPAVAKVPIREIVVSPAEGIRQDDKISRAVTLRGVSGLSIDRGEETPRLEGQSIFQGPEEELRWILAVFLAVAMLFFLEYEWIVRPFLRQRADQAIDPGRLKIQRDLPSERGILRDLAEVTFPWLLFQAWLPGLVTYVNLGFERLDHRRVVHAMLASLRTKYHRAFLAWNSPIANLGRLLGGMVLLLLVAIVGERWFAMPDERYLDRAALRGAVLSDYRNVCDLFEGKQQGPGVVNLICKLPWGERIFHILTYNLASVKISSPYQEKSQHLLFYLFPFLKVGWPEEGVLDELRIEEAGGRTVAPLFEAGIHLRIYHLLLVLFFYLLGRFILRRLPVFPYGEVLRKIDEVIDQISSTTSVTSTTGLPQPSNWLRGFFVDERVRQVQQDPMDPRTVELLFLNILDDIQSSAIVLPGGRSQRVSLPTPELTFVFDELDKLGSPVDPGAGDSMEEALKQREILDAERRRSAALHRLMADMKNLLSAAPARFIFVGGRNLHDEWLADQTARQPLLTNIFNAEVYLPSLLTDYSRREDADMHRNIGAYIRAQTRRAATLHAVAQRKENLPSFSLKVEAFAEEAFVPSTKEILERITEIAGGLARGAGKLRAAREQILVKEKDQEYKDAREQILETLRRIAATEVLTDGIYGVERSLLHLQMVLKELQDKLAAGAGAAETLRTRLGVLEAALRGQDIHLETWERASRSVQDLEDVIPEVEAVPEQVRMASDRLDDSVRDLERRTILLQGNQLGETPGGPKNELEMARTAIAFLKKDAAGFRDSIQTASDVLRETLADLEKEIALFRSLADGQVELAVSDVSGAATGADQARDLCTDLVQFLAYRSKGNPKRLKELLAGFIRPVGRVVEDPEVRAKSFPGEHVLMFDDVTRFRIQLLARLYRLLARSFRSRVPSYDDKLVMSVLFLADFLFKFHRRAFSWSNLERVDELAHIHRAPDLRAVLEKLVTDWTSRILHPIRNGMYDFRFLSEMAREIEYISRESQEEMAAFNFTLDESLTLKTVYESTIQRLSEEGRSRELEDLIAGLGELYEFDQEYETARLYYRKAISLLDEDLREVTGGGELLEEQSPALEIMGALPEGQSTARLYMTWGVTRLRLMLQIGMTFELARNYEKAEVEYRNAYTLARSLLLAMLDAEGRRRVLALGLASRLVVSADERLQELKHLTLLFQPAFAEAWIGEKLSGGVDTSIALVEKELWELRQILPFVRDLRIDPASSPIDAGHSNFALIVSELHNKAGDLYFMKGRQLVHREDLEPGSAEAATGETETVPETGPAKPRRRLPRKGQEGYLLQAHYHYCVALHELRRFVAHRRLSSKNQLNIWTAGAFGGRWETLSRAAWPAFVYSAAGEAFNDVAESMVARVSLHGLLSRQLDSRASGAAGAENSETFTKKLIKACTEWLDAEATPVAKEIEAFGKLPIEEYDLAAGSVGGWLGNWRADRVEPSGWQDLRLLDFEEWEEHDDATRLAVAVNFMLVGAKYLERGGYLEDAARESLKVCETVAYYLWWELAVQRLVDWQVLVLPGAQGQGQGQGVEVEGRALNQILQEVMSPEKRKARLPYWTYLTDIAVDALSEADEIYHRSRSGESSRGAVTFTWILVCSLCLAAHHLGIEEKGKLKAFYERWTRKPFTKESLRETLQEALVRYSYPMHNRLYGLVALIQDAVLDRGPEPEPEGRREDVLDWVKELMELQARLASPLYFTPFSTGVAYGLVFWYCYCRPKEHRYVARDVGKAAERDLAASQEMFTLRATYYQNISGLYYLYDDFNDRQMHFNHAVQMAGSELSAALRHSFYVSKVLESEDLPSSD